MYDLIIRNGMIVDGTGAQPFAADVAIKDGLIAAVGAALPGAARETIDAAGLIVTPGFVDIHTHYDGQATWDPLLEPSTLHGVTTVLMGACGVGFAPVHPGQEDWLIQLMEGVEDIPGVVLAEGMTWGWETFPQYLDILEKTPRAVDVAAHIPHGPVRTYVMGERGATDAPASPEEIAAMKAIVREAIDAGAFGFSTSRTITHRAMDGTPVPGTWAAEDELFGIGAALKEAGRGLFELAPAGVAGEDLVAPKKEVEWMCRLSAAIERPITYALTQVDAAPDQWRELMEESYKAVQAGAQVFPQIMARPTGLLIGLQSNHPFIGRPSYDEIAHLPLAERAAAMREPARRELILDEANTARHLYARMIGARLHQLYLLDDPPNYEPGPEMSLKALAAAEGVDIAAKAYDLMAADGGETLLLLTLFNYSYGNGDASYEMLQHPVAMIGLSDGGAHCGLMCDASMSTWILSHWVRDRPGPRISLEQAVRKQTRDTAHLYGMTDRGVIAPGLKADLNVIDMTRLRLLAPEMRHDLPAGGRRFIQAATGYVATVLSGEVVRREGVDTGARPGRLVRAGR